jgi:hypothetical protein
MILIRWHPKRESITLVIWHRAHSKPLPRRPKTSKAFSAHRKVLLLSQTLRVRVVYRRNAFAALATEPQVAFLSLAFLAQYFTELAERILE